MEEMGQAFFGITWLEQNIVWTNKEIKKHKRQ